MSHGLGWIAVCAVMASPTSRPAIDPEARLVKTCKDDEPDFVHVEVTSLPHMPDEASAQYLLAAIDRATRWVYVEILPEKTAHNAAGFLERILAQAPFKITRVLTDNGKDFADRFGATGENPPGAIASIKSARPRPSSVMSRFIINTFRRKPAATSPRSKHSRTGTTHPRTLQKTCL